MRYVSKLFLNVILLQPVIFRMFFGRLLNSLAPAKGKLLKRSVEKWEDDRSALVPIVRPRRESRADSDQSLVVTVYVGCIPFQDAPKVYHLISFLSAFQRVQS